MRTTLHPTLHVSKTRFRLLASVTILSFLVLASQLLVYLSSCMMTTGLLIGTTLVTLLGLGSAALWLRAMDLAIYKPIQSIRDHVSLLAQGQLKKAQFTVPNKEIGEVLEAVHLLTEGHRKSAEFAKEIGKGNFKTSYTTHGKQDVLGNALLDMRENMLAVAEEEKKRNWANEGIAKFGELLRLDTHDVEKFSDNILTQLIHYLEANQGAFYVLNEETTSPRTLTLTACYAWGRKKYIGSSIPVGQGLAGQVVLEREHILMTDVPQQYLHISSGLGHANPGCIIVLPLVYNDEVYGVIEMASFQVFQPYQVEFLNKLCTSIASAIAAVRVNVRTNKLLEESLLQGNELKEKDLVLRQQLEEVRAAQEEMERKEFQKKQMEWKTNAILEGCVDCIIAFNQQGIIEFFNKAAQNIWQIGREETIGAHISNLLPIEIRQLNNKCAVFGLAVSPAKELTGKTEFTVRDSNGEEIALLCSITQAKIGDECFFTAFIQNITVDIF